MTSGTGNCGQAMPIPPPGFLTFSKLASPRSLRAVRSVIVRADKGFYDHGLVEWLEAQQAGFVIVARLTGPIKRRLAHLRYTSPSRGVEVAEFRYQPTRWRRAIAS